MLGFVKTESQTADEYVADWKDDPWWEPIKEAHDLLSHFIPGYQPVQIKEKFGGLRFYYVLPVDDLPAEERDLYRSLANAIIIQAEIKAERIDKQRRWQREHEKTMASLAEEEE